MKAKRVSGLLGREYCRIGDIKGKERKKEKNRNDNGDDEKEEKAFNMIEEDGNN